jgi:hypothetical protein
MQISLASEKSGSTNGDKQTYRLIVFDSAGTAVLLESEGSGYRLPRIEVARFARPAEQVTRLLRDSRNMRSVFLFLNLLAESPSASYFAVLEGKDGFRSHPPGMEWVTIHHALSTLLLVGQERRAVRSSYLKAVHTTLVDSSQPFCRVGWMHCFEDWVQTALKPLGAELKDFEQWNGCESFSLMRLTTSKSDVWFKAVGESNIQEYSISQTLARLLPRYVPEILATKPEWHGWLMADAGGRPLSESADPAAWSLAATTLAQLQVDSMDKVEELRVGGFRDGRLETLLTCVDPFLEVVAGLMERQTKVPPPILTREEVNGLGAIIKDAVHCLASLRLPETLGHGDFNPANIIVGPERCIFIDWAEGHIGHPFLTFEYFLAHMRKDCPALQPCEPDFRACYSRVWSSIASPEQVAEAYLFSPLVAVYGYAVSSCVWRDPERLKVSGFQGYLRSLTRRMKEEADLLLRRRVECPN